MIYTDGTHLVTSCPDITELHLFASSIGLKETWFQNHPGHPHYDTLSGSSKHRALAAGAVLISSKAIVYMFRLLDERKRLEIKIDECYKGDIRLDYEQQLAELDHELNHLHECNYNRTLS